MWCYINGAFLKDEEAKISVLDRSFVYGDGCFEGIAALDGRLLHLSDHVERLQRSVRMLRINLNSTTAEIAELIIATASRNEFDKREMGYLRVVVSRGSGPLGVGFSASINKPNVVVIPQLGDRRVAYRGPIETLTAAVTEFARGSLHGLDPRIKANNYLPNILAFLEANTKGAQVALLRDEHGYVSEGHGMNLFCVRSGRLITSPESSALAGITRARVLAQAREAGVAFEERDLAPYDLYCADEVFITSSLESVAAISEIDGISLPRPVPGPLTSRLRELYVNSALLDAVPIPAWSGS